VQQLKSLSSYLITDEGYAGEIAPGTIEAPYHASLDRVDGHPKNDRDGLRRRLGGSRRINSRGNNHRHMPANEIGSERRQLVRATFAAFNGHVASHNVTGLRQAFVEPRQKTFRNSRYRSEPPYHRHRRLLRPRHHRPRRRAPEPRDEIPPSHP
jgi:hypothetical protein